MRGEVKSRFHFKLCRNLSERRSRRREEQEKSKEKITRCRRIKLNKTFRQRNQIGVSRKRGVCRVASGSGKAARCEACEKRKQQILLLLLFLCYELLLYIIKKETTAEWSKDCQERCFASLRAVNLANSASFCCCCAHPFFGIPFQLFR